ncbi:50S ribosomal protein L13 [candidate division KSB1 bacterium]|nr:50S ribosomal protein L13 [candidate division KSB1 bacterium]
MKTFSPKPGDIDRKWYVIDAEDQALGRLASKVAQVVRGKHKPIWAPHMDVGDFVVIVNADKVRVSGVKAENKKYYRHSGYPGGLRVARYAELMEKKPEFIIRQAVRGMLPHNRLGRKLLRKVKVYASSDHPHSAQQPEKMEL